MERREDYTQYEVANMNTKQTLIIIFPEKKCINYTLNLKHLPMVYKIINKYR